jgi:hypothetical protein
VALSDEICDYRAQFFDTLGRQLGSALDGSICQFEVFELGLELRLACFRVPEPSLKLLELMFPVFC